jgi:hypothetical protein
MKTIALAASSLIPILWLISAPSTAHAATLRTVALSGQQAPGAPGEINYGGFRAPVLNDAGQTAFHATLTGSGVDEMNDEGIWSEGSGTLALVARKGSQAPGAPSGVNFGPFADDVGGRSIAWSPVLNDAGQIAFMAMLAGADIGPLNDIGIWSEGSGNLALVAREGDHAAGMPSGVTYSLLVGGYPPPRPVLNNAGQVAFRSYLTGNGVVSTNDTGIWSERSGGVALVAREGDQAPGLPSGVNFGLFFHPALNDAGQTAFSGYLVGSGANSSIYSGLWSERSGSLALVARNGDLAPGTPGPRRYLSVGWDPAFNNVGQTAFFAWAQPLASGQHNIEGIWLHDSGGVSLVARTGEHAPGTPLGVNYDFIIPRTTSHDWQSPALNDTGQIAFSARLTNGSGGLWLYSPGGIALVALLGDHAPGTPDGVTFRRPDIAPFRYIQLNNAGQVAFSTALAGNGVDSTNNIGIWATDRTSAMQLIARTGDLLEVAPGDFRTISTLSLVFNPGTSLDSHAPPSG